MNRCFPPLPVLGPVQGLRRAALLVLLWPALMVVPAPAWAQDMAVRQFPPAAKRGTMTFTAPPVVQVNGDDQRLAPGVRIRNGNNMLVMSGALAGQTVVVNYMVERSSGMLQEVWILNPAELDQQRSGLDTVRNFVFGSDADKPKADDGKTPFNQLPKYPRQ